MKLAKAAGIPVINCSDGLYQVTTAYLCAGFVVQDGKVVDAAPILRKRLKYWITQAVRI
jgi:hypothetical protein